MQTQMQIQTYHSDLQDDRIHNSFFLKEINMLQRSLKTNFYSWWKFSFMNTHLFKYLGGKHEIL